ncbi:MAG: hypothetical protein ACTS73_01105 [Arsenophonus sp. NEOnobi-MAG3]
MVRMRNLSNMRYVYFLANGIDSPVRQDKESPLFACYYWRH